MQDQVSPINIKVRYHYESLNENKNPSFEEFNEFNYNVNQIHKLITIYTQPEYAEFISRLGQNIENIQTVSYHSLELKSICRENPFDLVLETFLNPEYLRYYKIVLKLLLAICRRYGNQKLREYVRAEQREANIDELLEEPNLYNSKFKPIVIKIMSNKSGQEILKQFCSSSIILDSIELLVGDDSDVIL